MRPLPTKNDFIDIHSHHKEKEEGVFRIYNMLITNLGEQAYTGFSSVGLHPWNIKEFRYLDRLDEILEKHFSEDSNIFVGECGLDKNVSISLDKQQEVFARHIQVSEKTSKPLIIHCVKAHQELLAIKKKFNPKQVWIIHGFNGSPQLANDLVGKGLSLSVGDSLLKKSDKAIGVLKRIPLSKLFLETDESDISIQELYSLTAIHLQLDIKELKKTITDNFIELFHNDR